MAENVKKVDIEHIYERRPSGAEQPIREINTQIYFAGAVSNEPRASYFVIKRVFDIVFSIIGLVICMIPMLLICFIIILDSPGSPLFLQERVGKDGKPFTMFKFRTMRPDAEIDGPRWADENDERCTRTGRFLRDHRLDELPQLINVLIGDMSFVGPRPERRCFYEQFDKYIIGFSNRLAAKPGITGYAQVNGGYDLLPEEKIVYDMKYINNRSIKMDLSCIFATFRVFFTKEGAR